METIGKILETVFSASISKGCRLRKRVKIVEEIILLENKNTK